MGINCLGVIIIWLGVIINLYFTFYRDVATICDVAGFQPDELQIHRHNHIHLMLLSAMLQALSLIGMLAFIRLKA